MAVAKKEKTPLRRGKGYFTLIGEAKVTDKTFPPESRSAKGFVGRRINLGVKISEGYTVYAEAFGGYNEDSPRELHAYVASKDKDADGNYKKGKSSKVAWEDRLSLDSTFENSIADFSMFVVSLEKDEKGKPFKKRFLSVYDAADYAQEHLVDGMRVMVQGQLKPNLYNGIVTYKKEITSIYLYTGDEVNSATGIVTVLVDKDSISGRRIKEDDEIDVNACFVAWSSKHNADVPYPMALVIPLNSNGDEKAKKVAKYVGMALQCKGKQVTEIELEVIFQEGNMVKEASIDDLDEVARGFVEDGLMSLEDVIGQTVVKGGRLNRILIARPRFEDNTGTETGAKLSVKIKADSTTYTTDDIEVIDLEESKVVEGAEATSEDIDKHIDSTEVDDSWLKKLGGI